MFNLNLGWSTSKAVLNASSEGDTINSGTAAAGAAIGTNSWFRSASASVGLTSTSGSYSGGNNNNNIMPKFVANQAENENHGYDDDDNDYDDHDNDRGEASKDNIDDPLLYRLQHQKRYRQEKKQHSSSGSRRRTRRSSRGGGGGGGGGYQQHQEQKSPGRLLKRSLSERSSGNNERRGSYRSSGSGSGSGRQKKERDPFDLWGSLSSSEDTSGMKHSQHSHMSTDNEGLDVVGWGNSPAVHRRTSSDRGQGQGRGRGQLLSDFGRANNDHDDDDDDPDSGLVVGFGGVTPQETKFEKRRYSTSAGYRPHVDPNFTSPQPARHTMSSSYRPQRKHSLNTQSQCTDNYSESRSIGSNDEYECDTVDMDGGGGCGSASVAHSSCPSHADLENILSSLEAASESMSPEEMMGGDLKHASGSRLSIVSSLSSPVEKCQSASGPENVTMPPLSLPPSSSSSLKSPTSTTGQQAVPQDQHEEEQQCIVNKRHERQSSFGTQQSAQHQQQQQQPPPQLKSPLTPRQLTPQQTQTNTSQTQTPSQPQHPHPRTSSATSPQKQMPRLRPPIIQQQQQQQQQQVVKVEEECPKLAQLKQQTTEELRRELSNMQHLSKTNLEKSWAEAEKMRVEVSEVEEKLEKIKKDLAVARATLMTGGGGDNGAGSNSGSGGGSRRRRQTLAPPRRAGSDSASPSQFISTKLCPSRPGTSSGTTSANSNANAKSKRSTFRRRKTIDGSTNESMLSDILSLADITMSMKKSLSARSLAAIANESSDDNNENVGGATANKSYSIRNNRNLSSGALGALMGSNFDNGNDISNDVNDGSSSGAGSNRSRGILASLGKSFRRSASSKGGANDFGFDFDDDDDSSSSSNGSDLDGASKGPSEFNDKVFKSLLAGNSTIEDQSVPMSVPMPTPTRMSMQRRGGICHVKNNNGNNSDRPPYADDSNRSSYRSESGDDSSDAQSGVFYPPPFSNDNDDNDNRSRYDSGDESSDAQSGVFYPPPMSGDESSDAQSGVFYPPPMSGDESSDAKSGVFYPPPLTSSESERVEQVLETQFLGPPVPRRPSYVDSSASVGALSEMDDFDFDPLGENTFIIARKEPIKKEPTQRGSQKSKDKRRGSNKSVGGYRRRPSGFVRRPSFMSLFDEKSLGSDTDSFSSIAMKELLKDNKKDKKEEEIAQIKLSIIQKDEEIVQLNGSTQIQEETKLSAETEIETQNAKNTQSEAELQEKESKLQEEVQDLEERDSGINERLDNSEGSEQLAREREHVLKEELSLMDENLDEDESEIDLESLLASCRDRYETCQDNAIETLSGLLDDFDAIRIPSLRGEFDDDVAEDITSLFDALTDKEGELVAILSDGTRLASCQAAFQQIQKNIEMAVYYKNGLANMELDLRCYLDTISTLIKRDGGDENTTTTESSTTSERLGLERLFLETILGQLEMTQRNQGKMVLDALSEAVALLTHWDELLLPEFDSESSHSPDSGAALISSPNTLNKVVDAISKAKAELNEAKLDILNEQAHFQAKLQSVGLNSSRSKNNYDHHAKIDHDYHRTHNDTEQHKQPIKENAKEEELNEQLFGQISTAEKLLSARESLMNKYASFINDSMQAQQGREEAPKPKFQLLHQIFEEEETADSEEQLEELGEQISTATLILSEKESLMKAYSLDLNSMQAQASEEARANEKLVNAVQMKINHILTKMADEERAISSLESLLLEKREKVEQLHSRLFNTRRKGSMGSDGQQYRG